MLEKANEYLEAEPVPTEPTPTKPITDENVIVVYFSHGGENYGVGVVEKGNTAVMAEYISSKIQADMFEIQPAIPYPEDYDEMTELAQKEQRENARP